VLRLGVLASLLETVRDGRRANAVAAQALVNALLQFCGRRAVLKGVWHESLLSKNDRTDQHNAAQKACRPLSQIKHFGTNHPTEETTYGRTAENEGQLTLVALVDT
jgi:hypothetical protein